MFTTANNNTTHNTNNKSDFDLTLKSCESYMLTNLNLLKCINESEKIINYDNIYEKKIINIENKPPAIKKRKVEQVKKEIIKEEIKFSEIIQKDQLFWCFYIIKYGYEDYQMINQPFLIEKNLKIECINQIRKNKELLKKYKLKKTEIESELLNDEKLTLKGFLAICIYNNINFILINNRKYYELTVTDDISEEMNEYNIVKFENKNYSVDITEDKELIKNKIVTYRNNYYKIDNLTKPIRAFSSYSLTDLHEICNNLQIKVTNETGKKLQKKELYTEILKHF